MIRSVCVALLALLLAACGPLAPYRIDIQQGNYVTQEMVSQLRSGMTKEQVRYLLGTPLMTDIFHADRWASTTCCAARWTPSSARTPKSG